MGFAAAILAMVLLFAGCGQTETKSESSTAASEKHRIRKYSIRKYADREQHSGIGNRR